MFFPPKLQRINNVELTRRQITYNCGYTLWNCLQQHWLNRNDWNYYYPYKPYYPAQPCDIKGAEKKTLMHLRKILNLNPNIKDYRKWGIFSTTDFTKIGSKIGYQCRVLQAEKIHLMLRNINYSLASGLPVVIAFDNGSQGKLGFSKGEKAHWGMVCGYGKNNGRYYYNLVDTQNKSRKVLADTLCKSNFQLLSCNKIKLDLSHKIIVTYPNEIKKYYDKKLSLLKIYDVTPNKLGKDTSKSFQSSLVGQYYRANSKLWHFSPLIKCDCFPDVRNNAQDLTDDAINEFKKLEIFTNEEINSLKAAKKNYETCMRFCNFPLTIKLEF